MVQEVMQRAERVRDLKGQIAELTAEEQGDILFIDVSPQRKRVALYSMLNGEPIRVPIYMAQVLLQHKLPDGRFAFTSDQGKAPHYKKGTTKCFLHPEAMERSIIDELGLGGVACNSAGLANPHSKRIHAQHRHKQEWAAYQENLNGRKEEENRQRMDKQLEATLAIAAGAVSNQKTARRRNVATGEFACDFPDCGRVLSTKLALAGHRRSHREVTASPG